MDPKQGVNRKILKKLFRPMLMFVEPITSTIEVIHYCTPCKRSGRNACKHEEYSPTKSCHAIVNYANVRASWISNASTGCFPTR